MIEQTTRMLLVSGIVLLAASALLGFMQARQQPGSEAHARWRVVHAGGTAGAVQLIALAAVWEKLAQAQSTLLPAVAAIGVGAASWAFFVGPLLHALGEQRWHRRVNLLGALLAVPGYLALPLLLR